MDEYLPKEAFMALEKQRFDENDKDAVMELQRQLNLYNKLNNTGVQVLQPDGFFGPVTMERLKSFKIAEYTDGSLSIGYLKDRLGMTDELLAKYKVNDKTLKTYDPNKPPYDRENPPKGLLKYVQEKFNMPLTDKMTPMMEAAVKKDKIENFVDGSPSDGALAILDAKVAALEKTRGSLWGLGLGLVGTALVTATAIAYGSTTNPPAKQNTR